MKKFLRILATVAVVAGASVQAGTMTDFSHHDIVVGDKIFHWISSSPELKNTNLDVSFTDPAFSILDSHLNPVSVNTTFEFSVHITDPKMGFDQLRVSENDVIKNKTAGSVTTVYSNSTFSPAALLSTTILHKSGMGSEYTFTNNYRTIFVREVTTGVDKKDHLASINFDLTQTPIPNPNYVPEPSTFALMALGGLGLVIRAVRRRQIAI